MAAKTIHTERELSVDAETVWQQIGGFDLDWHPQVTGCTLLRTANGTLVREFEDLHGKTYCEERTYISDTDRVLSYRLTSGIDGLIDYLARVDVRGTDSGGTVITWQAEIVANPDRLETICQGTQDIFEAGFDALGSLPRARANRIPKPTTDPGRIVRGSLDSVPELSFLKTEGADTNPKTLVLFLHGIGGQASNWASQLERLGDNFAMAAMDLRGYGKSALGSRSTQIDDYCADILRLSDAYNAEKLVLVGLS
ncbi:MAG: alpha/beta fold hydrolase, partial [Pseudomonadota bacterium]